MARAYSEEDATVLVAVAGAKAAVGVVVGSCSIAAAATADVVGDGANIDISVAIVEGARPQQNWC